MDSFEISSKFSVIKTTSKVGNPIAKGISRLVSLFFPGSLFPEESSSIRFRSIEKRVLTFDKRRKCVKIVSYGEPSSKFLQSVYYPNIGSRQGDRNFRRNKFEKLEKNWNEKEWKGKREKNERNANRRRGRGGEEQSFVSRQQNKIQNGVIGRICWNLNTGHELGFIR